MERRVSSCFIRISKILLYAIHNYVTIGVPRALVVLSGFQRYFCMQYTTYENKMVRVTSLFYQDFKDTFVCNTQRRVSMERRVSSCFIRISKILLYAIHNYVTIGVPRALVVLSGFQRYFCMQYTTYENKMVRVTSLFYQDFKDTFVCNTQPIPTQAPSQ